MNYSFQDRVIELRCPACKGDLSDQRMCTRCGLTYGERQGVPFLMDDASVAQATTEERGDIENAFKNFFKRWPNFYQWGIRLVAPVLFSGLSAKGFLKRFSDREVFLNVGSGPTKLHPHMLNVDLFPFTNVNIVAKGDALPFAENVFDAVCNEEVLEHVPRPEVVVAEMKRVTKSGGYIYTAVPFIFPYHPSPKDYRRYTIDGLRMLFQDCEEIEAGVLCGPVSGMLIVTAGGLSMILSFGFLPLQKILNYLFMLILSPIKLLDYLFARLPNAETVAAGVYLVVKKQ